MRIEAGIDARATVLRGKVTIELRLASRTPIVLDWRPARAQSLASLRVNGARCTAARLRDEHLLIPATHAAAGMNRIQIGFTAPIAPSGGALVSWQDPADRARYVYSLFVPAEARTVFPCFDQPDLKTRFTLALTTPGSWHCVGNAPLASRAPRGRGRVIHHFEPTAPISTYLFAFAAGPFVRCEDAAARVPTQMWVRRSRRAAARTAAPEVFEISRRGIDAMEDYLAEHFPFPKYDLVALPGFPFGGMEHAGATFSARGGRPAGRREPPVAESMRRRQLILHETAHQWMGDSVTMRWFDDLWLKEGFANFLAAKVLRAIGKPGEADTMLAALKQAALATDLSAGSVPLHQPLANLNAAKSLYGTIVYGKAPAVLAEAERLVGAHTFRAAVRSIVRAHRFASFDSHELVAALERASGHDLEAWAQAWIFAAGAPILSAGLRLDSESRIDTLTLTQAPARYWPMRVDLALVRDARTARIAVSIDRATVRVARATGARAPTLVLLDPEDRAYGRFRLDDASLAALLTTQRIPASIAPAVVDERIWDALRETRIDPPTYLEYALRALDRQYRSGPFERQLARIEIVCRRYLLPRAHAACIEQVERALLARARGRSDRDRRAALLRTFTAIATSSAAVGRLPATVGAAVARPAIALRLVVLGALAPAAAARLVRQHGPRADLPADFGAQLEAATPTATTKRRTLARLLDEGAASDGTVERVLPYLTAPEHAHLTKPLLARALAALPRLRNSRSIFIVNRWVESFVESQTAPSASPVIEAAAVRLATHPELRRKILESQSEYERTIRLRTRPSTT